MHTSLCEWSKNLRSSCFYGNTGSIGSFIQINLHFLEELEVNLNWMKYRWKIITSRITRWYCGFVSSVLWLHHLSVSLIGSSGNQSHPMLQGLKIIGKIDMFWMRYDGVPLQGSIGGSDFECVQSPTQCEKGLAKEPLDPHGQSEGEGRSSW